MDDHARLKKLFAALVVAFRAEDREQCAALWTACDKSLEAHMLLEEQLILPEFAKADAVEAAALAREHGEIRAALAELGIGVDLHCTSAEAVERFARALEEHAQREDGLMYRWASGSSQQNSRQDVPPTLRAQVHAALRKVVGRSGGRA